jgi:hypothetical protein
MTGLHTQRSQGGVIARLRLSTPIVILIDAPEIPNRDGRGFQDEAGLSRRHPSQGQDKGRRSYKGREFSPTNQHLTSLYWVLQRYLG